MTRETAIALLNNLRAFSEEDDEPAIDMAIEALSAEDKGDLISRRWLLELYGDYIGDDGESKYHVPLEVVRQNIKDAPSADAKPTVIRSKTLMPTKDFNEWAKRVRETNPDAVVIPCDAEVVLSDIEKWRTWSHTYDNMCKETPKVDIPEPCKKCSNHPRNGGSGVCLCTLGSHTIRW